MKRDLIGKTWSTSMGEYKVIDKFRDYFIVERTELKSGLVSQRSLSFSELSNTLKKYT